MTEAKLPACDHRKLLPQIYRLKPGPVVILQTPPLQYVSQPMTTAYHMHWAGRPEPVDESWIVWKIVNQLKQITKKSIGYKFTLMPPEIVWHAALEQDRWSVFQMMQIPGCITPDMFDQAKAHVAKNLRGRHMPETSLIQRPPVLCAQKLHVGHYRSTQVTLNEIKHHVAQEGFRVIGSHREIYLTPAMQCHAPETWRTVISVNLAQ